MRGRAWQTFSTDRPWHVGRGGYPVAHGRSTLLNQAKQLTPADRLELIAELWQTLDHDELPISDADRDLLDDRIRDLAPNPDAGRPWEEFDADLRHRFP